jgi:hypothetical protein
MFVNSLLQQLGSMQSTPHDIEVLVSDLSRKHEIELFVSKPTIIVSTYALQDGAPVDQTGGSALDGKYSQDIKNYLRISSTSLNMIDRLWTANCSTNCESNEAVEFCVAGRFVERILFVFSIPVQPSPQEEHVRTVPWGPMTWGRGNRQVVDSQTYKADEKGSSAA